MRVLLSLALLTVLSISAAFAEESAPQQSKDVPAIQKKNPLCAEFDALFSTSSEYAKVSAMNGEDRRVDFHMGSFYTDAADEKLYSLFTIRRDEDQYKAIVQLYPSVDLVLLVPDVAREKRSKEFPHEIDDFIKPLKWVRNEKWHGEIFPNSKSYEMCEPLSHFIPGNQFADKHARRFIRHFPFGKRRMSTRYGCENWGTVSDQMLFYESFVPSMFHFKTGDILYVDPDYPGIEKNGEFNYICGMSGVVGAREKVLAEEPAVYTKTPQYLLEKGILSADDEAAYYSSIWKQQALWEMEVTRNLIEGRDLYNK